jgi:hypothetical protein
VAPEGLDDPYGQDLRPRDILATTHNLPPERAAGIEGESLQRSFLENVAAHRELIRPLARE